jgi:type VI secretion system protein
LAVRNLSTYEERLLERIRSFERNPLRRGGKDQRHSIDSVLAHLQRILNTRQGNVPLAADYGVPDFLNFLHTYPESIHEIETSIKTAIDKYEPRLSETSVTFVPDEDDTLTLRFQIMASLTVEDGRKVFFETVVDTDGRISIHK